MFEFLLVNYSNHSVYVHNLSGFDAVFLLDTLASLKIKSSLDFLLNKIGSYDVDLIMKDGKIITITIKKIIGFSKNNKIIYKTIYIKDSLLILPSSLDKLGKAFNVGSKSAYDYNLLNNNINDINRVDLLKYNVEDCILLYKIIKEFQDLIFKLFVLDIHKYPTLTSLAFTLYRKNFMARENIPVTSFEFYNQIKDAYSGGHVDLYKPFGKNLFYYDVNSLYPYVMKANKYPIGNATYFKGHKNINEVFGISSFPFGRPV